MGSDASLPRLNMIVDALDDQGNVVGQLPRRELPRTACFRVVHVLVVNPLGSILVQKIAKPLRHAGQWGSSVAGYLHAGESYRQAAKRKLRDELGIRGFEAGALTVLPETRMRDLGVTKFIGVFVLRHEGPVLLNQEDAVGLEFLLPREIERRRAGEQRDHHFTRTFLHVFDHVRAQGAL
jgi:isopentenyl-diphosphate delta-isomerase